ncbi:OsmC family protein [Brevibacillus sp. SYSU BS000544]|uniref:OsmC family protein n=1 Tax=Brevibacillus sp. SYSU BS000544 TaxID=3416443 RepID=UPI003CE4AEDD
MEQHFFHMEANWRGGRLSTGELKGNGMQATISVPAELGGPGQGTNPEEMLIGSAMTCYLITLAAILDKRQIPVESITLHSEGKLTVEEGNLGFRAIIHRPTIRLNQQDEKILQNATHAAHRAEQLCMISKALRGNVEVTVEPTFEVVVKQS